MSNLKEYFQSELDKHLDQAKSLTDVAEKEGRSLTEGEREEVKTFLAKATEFKTKVDDMEATEAMRKSIEKLGEGLVTPEITVDNSKSGSVGEAFVKSDGYRALKERGLEGRFSTVIQIPSNVWAKANTGFVAFTEGNNADVYQVQREPGIQLPVEVRPTVADLLGQGTVSPGNNTITYVKETVTTNAAAVVAEGAAKPPSDVGLKTESTGVLKIATTLTVSDEMLDDIQAIQSYLNNRLSLFVRQGEENEVLRGTGGGSHIDGILHHAIGDQAASDIGGDNLFDSILAAITYVRVNSELEPDAMVMHPGTFAAISVLKTQSGGTYFSGGPYASPNQNPWGLRTVITTNISEGHVLVGAFKQGATLWRKGGLTIEATNGYQDYFQKNLTMIRAEERVGLTVYRDAAFCIAREGS